MNRQHTPLPWTHCADANFECRHLISLDPEEPGSAVMIGDILHPKDAELIVEAVNNYEQLKRSLKNLYVRIDTGYLVRNTAKDSSPEFYMEALKFVGELREAQEAIEKAEGKS